MLKKGKSRMLSAILVLAAFFAAGYFYSNFRNSPKPLTSTSKTTTGVAESGSPVGTESALTKYYPLQKGNYWEYEGIKREQLNAKDIETSNVKRRIEVLDVQETEEGTIVSRDSGSDYLIKGNNVFSRESWGDELRLPFPLYVGQKWGDEDSIRFRDDNFYMGYVEEKLSKTILGKKYDECFKITNKVISAPTAYEIFCYGIGYVEGFYEHKGTVDERKNELTGTNVGN